VNRIEGEPELDGVHEAIDVTVCDEPSEYWAMAA
jgi:hypothetical protein